MNPKADKEITIYDIARKLQVSPTTVSRALNNHPSIGKKTTLAVQEMALQLGYRPNSIASSLRKNKTNTIGVIISWINRPFLSSLVSGIEEVANRSGYNVIISQSCDSYEKEVNNVKALYATRVDGLIVSLAMETQQYEHFRMFQKKHIPVVFLDRVSEEMDTERVMIDNFAAGFAATEHLIQMGCRRIAHFAGAQHRNIYRERQNGYRSALQQYGLKVDESMILSSNLSMDDGYRQTASLMALPRPPDAIFSANDSAAVGAIQYAKSQGIRVPDDLAVVGFNNDPVSSIIDPALSTMTHPAFDMGRIAAQQLLKHLGKKQAVPHETIVLETGLLIRASSQKVNPAGNQPSPKKNDLEKQAE